METLKRVGHLNKLNSFQFLNPQIRFSCSSFSSLSLQGLPQMIQLGFPRPVIPGSVSITFQGGFVGTRCSIQFASPTSGEWEVVTRIFPEDNNRLQSFALTPDSPNPLDAGVEKLKLVFEESSDFFGRITIYDLRLEGHFPQ